MTDFQPEDDVLNVYEDKYKELNIRIRLHIGIMSILNRPDLLDQYDYIGFQRCSVISNFSILEDLSKFNKDTFYFVVSNFQGKSLLENIEWWSKYSSFWNMQVQNIWEILNNILSHDLKLSDETIRFMLWFMFDKDKKFVYNVNMILHKNRLDEIRQINSKALIIWNELMQFVDTHYKRPNEQEYTWFFRSVEFYEVIQSYLYLKLIGIDNINTDSRTRLFEFKDRKYHYNK